MSSQLSRMLGTLGAEVLETLWDAPRPLTVREVQERLNRARPEPLAYTTIMTVLARLAERDILVREMNGRAYVYQAVVADAAELAVRDVIRDHGEMAVAHFVDMYSAELGIRSRLSRLIRDEDAGG